MIARHLAPSPRRTSTSELLGAVAGRRGKVRVEVSHPVSKRLPGARHHYDGVAPEVSEVVAFARGYRLFVLEGAARAASRYVVFGRLAAVPVGRGPERDAVLAAAHPAGGTAERDREFGRPV